MANKETLLELTEHYLKSLISETTKISIGDSGLTTPFQELGIDSFRVLQIIKKLEEEFGNLPKTLLFENFNISDLSHYFVNKHEQAIVEKFANEKQTTPEQVDSAKKLIKQPIKVDKKNTNQIPEIVKKKAILILEKEVDKHPELKELIDNLFNKYKNEGSASRGTRNIAPNLFIGSHKRGYFNYCKSKNILLVYTYTGPKEYLPALAEEMYQYCIQNNYELTLFSDHQLESIGSASFTATPFGILSRIVNIKDFSLGGSKMRRLRYQVSKFESAGKCKTLEYQNGSNKDVDKNIVSIIDEWCAPRTMVNPLIHMVKDEISRGKLNSEHRLFLTYLDDVLQNVILISKLSDEENGYLMDLEFYPQSMPLGGLEFAIVQIIKILASEGCNMLSLGGTYGCILETSSNADPEIEKTLNYLRENKIFNDEGNLQFKNKFRPEHNTVYLCRPKENSNPDNVTDIIMMIADPQKMQSSNEQEYEIFDLKQNITEVDSEFSGKSEPEKIVQFEDSNELVIEGNNRSLILSEYGFNPQNLPHDKVEFDLQTDSWAQLEMPSIQNHLRFLNLNIQQGVDLNESLKTVFPFSYFALTKSGRTAEHAFFKTWTNKGEVLQNLLFPTTIFHQIENGFTPVECPHDEVFNLNSKEVYKGNLDFQEIQKRVEKDSKSIALVIVEVDNNASGGFPVSIPHLQELKSFLNEYSIPLVIDGTRILENAQFIRENENEHAQENIWEVAQKIFSYADAVIASLAKDFCVKKGGLIATNDKALYNKLQDLIMQEGIGLDVIDKKLIALSLAQKNKIETQLQRRIDSVRLVGNALIEKGVPIVQPARGHCILIDVKQFTQFNQFKFPVASFVAWLYQNTGIRTGLHNVGMQKNTSINDVVRLAITVGLKKAEIDEIIKRLIQLFSSMENIPEIELDGSVAEKMGDIYAKYKLKQYHHVNANIIPKTSLPKSSNTNEENSISAENESITFRNTEPFNKEIKHSQDIAIVGMAGRYPKAVNISEFWKNLSQGRDCIEIIPDARFNKRLRNKFSEKYRGGFIDNVDKFDSLFFNISPREAEFLDPQDRLFLEVAWEVLEDAGYYPEIFADDEESRNIGVFVGAVWTLYQMYGVEEKFKGNNQNPSSHLWAIANRVSYAFNFSGPSMSIDTACSSSLTALYLACEAINKGECNAAIVGGVNLDVHQSKIDINNGGGALSKDGICRTFGKGANGYVAGEGVGALLLKPLDKAIKDGDNIHGVIKGIAVNHGGKTSGFMVPSPQAQAKVINTALKNGRIDARTIGYIEAHGTGTELGDPIEINGLTSAFENYNVDLQSCSIGSVKTNIGHLEAAAGIVGVHKVLLQMKHKKLVPSLHSSELNPFIEFEKTPFYVEQVLEDWKPKVVEGVEFPLRAGISSFGAGGANSHLIIEEYIDSSKRQDVENNQFKDQIFPLSARNENQLREAAIRLKKFIQDNLENEVPELILHLSDIAHTLRFGRKSFEYRVAIIAKTNKELVEKLNNYIEGKTDDTIITGKAENNDGITKLLSRHEKQEFIKLLNKGGDFRKLAQVWVEGLFSDWKGMEVLETGKKVSLPTYPFADRRHWISDSSEIVSLTTQTNGKIHPLIDSNESTFERQIFKKTFHENDFFIYDHLVSDVPTLPGVAYLDFARKAGELALGRKVQKIKNILWLSPITVVESNPIDVFIELKPNGESVNFEVFSEKSDGEKQLHSQGKIAYATMQELEAEPEFIDLESIQSRCSKVVNGKDAYPQFKSLGLDLGPGFQVLQEVYQNEDEILGILEIPQVRQADFHEYLLHPSLIDGTGQAGMAAQLAKTDNDSGGEMFVPYSFGEVEILHPVPQKCFAYIQNASDKKSKVTKTNILVADESGKVVVKIKDSVGIPLVNVHEKPDKINTNDEFLTLHYTPVWDKSPIVSEQKETFYQSLLFFDTDETLFEQYKACLKKAGKPTEHVILVKPGKAFQSIDEQTYCINPQNPDNFNQLFEALNKSPFKLEKVCFAWSFNQNLKTKVKCNNQYLKEELEKGVYSILYLTQAIIKQQVKNEIKLVYLYSSQKPGQQPHNDAMSGYAKTLHIEHSKLSFKTLEIQQAKSTPEGILDIILDEYQQTNHQEMTVRYVEQERYTRKLKEYKFEESENSSSTQLLGIKEKGVYLIAGGAGGLGFIFADYLAKEYKARLVLTGRSDLSNEQKNKLEQLREMGSEVLYIRADIAKAEDVAKLVKESKSKFGKIDGIINSAGVLRDSYIKNKTSEEMEAVLAPKLYGSVNLDKATQNEDIDFFVMFSSMAAISGNMGQCDYAFANSFLDSFADYRRQLKSNGKRTGKSLSINWSIWADGGMQLDEQTEIFFKKNLGITPLHKETGIQTFERGLGLEQVQLAVVEGDKDKIELAWGLREEEVKNNSATENSQQSGTIDANGTQADRDLVNLVQNELSQIVMEFLKLEAEDISIDKILMDLGFDSIGLATFANAVNEKYDIDDVTPVLFFEYPSIEAIAGFLCLEHKDKIAKFHQALVTTKLDESAHSSIESANSISNQEFVLKINKGWNPDEFIDKAINYQQAGNGVKSFENRFVDMPIAIVGMAGVMPQAEDLDEFWQKLANAENNMVTLIPKDRWSWEEYYGDPLEGGNKTKAKWGGFMKEVDKFDPLFWGISPMEAEAMDPQQRIFLETVYKAIEDSGHKVSELSGTKTGVFVGAATRDYIDIMNEKNAELSGYSGTGTSHAVLANRVSYLLNLHGPSAPLDTACSSSLVALHRAIESIHTGSSEMAIVGGVQVMLTPAAFISFGAAGMLADDGRCKTFDDRADGYVRGEGSGAIIIKPLAKAEEDGDHIYAVIKSTAENHGGKVTVLTAPNPNAQADLLVEAYEKAGVDPSAISYIECHGTGTKLGDPIEIKAMKKAFEELYKKHNKTIPDKPHVGLTSVKTNIGHLETGAGIAGILKVLLSMKHKQIPQLLHFQKLNSFIKLEGTPLYMVDKLREWEVITDENGKAHPRVAGVSSFGFGGANVHVVLEEYIPKENQLVAQTDGPFLIVLSAKNIARLKEFALKMVSYIENEEFELADFAYTLQIGKDEMAERLAFVASNKDELQQKFKAFVNGDSTTKDLYHYNTQTKKGITSVDENAKQADLQTLINQKELDKLAMLWVSGVDINWESLYNEGLPKRLSLPTYPFARESYWLTIPDENAQIDDGTGKVQHLHPLVQRNVSTFKEQKFSALLTGDEFFLADHMVGTQKILPGVAYMEIARVAGELSGNAKVQFIRDLVWMRPFIVENEPKELQISLLPNNRNEFEFSINTVTEEEIVPHCYGKIAYSGTVSEPSHFDVVGIRSRCNEEVYNADNLYEFLRGTGLNLGTGFQIVQNMYANEHESLAVVKLPEHLKKGANQFWLHPALMDGSIHSGAGLLKKSAKDIPFSLPYSVGEVQVIDTLENLQYGYATWTEDNDLNDVTNLKTNFYLLDNNGKVLVRILNFISKPLFKETGNSTNTNQSTLPPKNIEAGELHILQPVWNPLGEKTFNKLETSESSKILLLGGHLEHLNWIRKSYKNTDQLQLTSNQSIEALENMLRDCSFDQLFWIAPDLVSKDEDVRHDNKNIIASQEEGVLTIFRIVKALLKLGYDNKTLNWTFITGNTQKTGKEDQVLATHAGVFGFVGSLAKEFPGWNLRILDIDSLNSVTVKDCTSFGWDKQGDGLAHRNGKWFVQGLKRGVALPLSKPIYKNKGVYVVIGGAGGIGEVWSRYMIINHQAKIIWIGRREADAEIKDKIKQLGQVGEAPIYISADATKQEDLEQACKRILESYPSINGVVHSALVLKDQSLTNMSESAFKVSLSSKVDISVNMVEVFARQDIDFMLFFSSIASFFKTPGQSNYTAGCSFKDSFAHSLNLRNKCHAKVMNWGYWGSVGVAADEASSKRLAQMGIGSIEPEEGMSSLQTFVDSDVSQVILMKVLSNQLLDMICLPEEGNYSAIAAKTSVPKSYNLYADNSKSGTINHGADSVTKQAIIDFVEQTITDTLAKGLKMEPGLIPNDASYADYGVDSIVGVNLIRTINRELGLDLEAIVLFEHGSVNKLTHFLVANYSDTITKRLAESAGVVETSAPKSYNSKESPIDYVPSEVSEQMIVDFVEQTITKTLAEGLKMNPEMIPNDASYADFGVDSIVGVNLIRTINKELGLDLEAIVLFEHGSVSKLTQFLVANWSDKIVQKLSPTNSTLQSPTTKPVAENANISLSGNNRFISSIENITNQSHISSKGNGINKLELDHIAIIGMSGRFSESDSIEEFWEYLKTGKEMINEAFRWSPSECVVPGTKKSNYCTRAGFLKSAEYFDPTFFKIPPIEAQYMDPQQRLFLEEAYRALEDAGYAGNGVDGKECGVYVGCGATGYSDLFKEDPPPQAFWGNAISVIPARIAYYLNLMGPAVSIDTACSSSLVAIHSACQGLWSQETDMALAGGVFVMPTPGYMQNSNRAGMLSLEGKTYAFDSRANGFVPGEGVGVVVLKRLQKAIEDGDNIHGVIIGTGINQDGSTNGITAPNALSQEKLELSIYDRFKINPDTIQLVEAHGTGTPLGDPIEYRALNNSFRKYSERNQFCALGSVKTNIGHAATAAGVAGAVKILLSLKNKQLPPSINFEEGNPAIKFESSPFYVNTKLQEWKTQNNQKRRAALSSFGFSGTNSHMIFEEAPTLQEENIQAPAYLIVLSAQTAEQLKQQAVNLLELCKKTTDLSLNNMSYTLFVGRKQLQHRLACVVRSHKELVQLLEKWIETESAPQVYTSVVNENKVRQQVSLKNFANQCIQECRNGTSAAKYIENLSTIAELYTAGYKLGFDALFSKGSKRISLPTYPFARERYWVDSISSTQGNLNISTNQIHPLLHTNTSDLSQQSYSISLGGEEFFVADHIVNGNKVLPGVAYLEMARAAVMDAAPVQVEFNSLELHNIIWRQPIAVINNKEIALGLILNDNDEIEFDVYSQENDAEVIHCRGRAMFSNLALPGNIDIEQLKSKLQESSVDVEGVYESFVKVGIKHGPSYQGVTSLFKGEQELLAKVTLPAIVANTQSQFILHPSVMDSALQASMGLIMDENSSEPKIPFALEYVRIISPCTKEMFAWIRYSEEDQPGNNVTKLDIDLCDSQGNICVQMYGFSARAIKITTEADHKKTVPTALTNGVGLHSLVPVWTVLSKEKYNKISVPESANILLLGGTRAQLGWIQKTFKKAQLLDIPSGANIAAIESILHGETIDQLIWMAPDVTGKAIKSVNGIDRMITDQEQGVLTVFRIAKALLNLGYTNKTLNWTLITGNTHLVVDGDMVQPAHSGVFGLVGSLAKEFPGWNIRLLDIDSLNTVAANQCVSFDWNKQGDGLAHRKGEWYEQGLKRNLQIESSPTLYKQNGVYVVIGGAGGVGEVWSRFMIENYQAKIVWVGRRKSDAVIHEKINQLSQIGHAPLYISADATKLEDLEQVLEQIKKVHTNINGVVHSALVLQDQSLAQMDETKFKSGLKAKVDISVNLARVFGAMDLDFMLFFSSIVSFFKTPGQSNYAAGCAFKDSFAQSIKQQYNFPVKIMNWGYWGSVGVATDDFYKKRTEQMGIGSIEPEEGMLALQSLIDSNISQEVLIKVLNKQLIEAISLPEQKTEMDETTYLNVPITKEIGYQDSKLFIDKPDVKFGSTQQVMKTIAENPKNETYKDEKSLREKSISYFQNLIGEMLRMQPQHIEPQKPLSELGLDSIMVGQLTDNLRKVFDDISATLFFEVQSVGELADYFIKNSKEALINAVGWNATETTSSKPETISKQTIIESSSKEYKPLRNLQLTKRLRQQYSPQLKSEKLHGRGIFDVAIVGLSGRYPKSNTLDEFWSNLSGGVNCISEIPQERWNWEEYYDPKRGKQGKMYTKWGGFLKDIDKFDPLFFKISPVEAEGIDPQERLFIETCYHAIEDAGYTPKNLDNTRKVGVFAGVLNSRYTIQPNFFSFANRVSYLFNFQGPSMAVDTACSSSLTAIHLALESLYSGLSSVAIAGGVNLIIDPMHYLQFVEMNMLSGGDKCKAFGANADGFIDAEGVGAVILKPLIQAEQDGDHIYGVIKGSSVNAGGKTNGYTVPNPKVQSELIADALKRSNVSADQISYLEAHGTGTALGDPIEISALTNAFSRSTERKQFCAIGSTKSNIGHCESAAGIASLTKVLLQIKHQQLVPTLNATEVNPEIDFSKTPFKLQQHLEKWERPKLKLNGATQEIPRIAGISSFGAGGANVHLVVQEYIPSNQIKQPDDPQEQTSEYIIPLSAKSAEQLTQKSADLLHFIRKSEQENLIQENSFTKIDMRAMAYTLQIGREAMEERIGFVVESVDQLAEKIEAFLDGNHSIEGVYRGNVKNNRETLALFTGDTDLQEAIEKWFINKKLSKLLDLWVKGLDLEWEKLYNEVKHKRMSVPVYPFAKQRCWKDSIDDVTLNNIQNKADDGSLMKTNEIQDEPGILMLKPVWKEKPLSSELPQKQFEFAENHVFLAELKQNSTILKEHNSQLFFYDLNTSNQGVDEQFQSCASQLFEFIKKLNNNKPDGKVLLQVVIPNNNKALSGLSGLLKTAHLENSKLFGQVIEVQKGISPTELVTLLGKNGEFPEDQEVRYTNKDEKEIRWVNSFEEFNASPSDKQLPWKEGGVYLITGGAGGLGLLFAKEIGDKCKEAVIVLTGRSRLNAKKKAKIKELESSGIKVIYKSVDIINKKAVKKLVQDILNEFGKLNGILHSAGITRDNYITKKTTEEFRSVLAPKVSGTVNLEEAVTEINLDLFVLFSSGSGVMGNMGQADYATANAFMDSFAGGRMKSVKKRGRTLSINWPLWKDGGMTINEATEIMLTKSLGIVSMETSTGIEAFYKALLSSSPQVLVISGLLKQIRRNYLSAVQNTPQVNEPDSSMIKPSTTKNKELQPKLQQLITSLVSEMLKIKVEDLDASIHLNEYGFDSISLTNFTNKLNEEYQLEVNPVIFLEHSNIESFANYLCDTYQDVFTKLLLEKEVASVSDNFKTEELHQNIEEQVDMPKSGTHLAKNDSIWTQVVNQAPETNKIIIPIKSKGKKRPIFAVPGVGGNVLCFQPLGQALDGNQPIYGLQSVGLDGKTTPFNSAEKIAKTNIAAIRTVQPTGPYTLLGYSNGGAITFEMVNQLLQQNEEIASLLLVDSLCPTLQTDDEIDRIVFLYQNLAKMTGMDFIDLDTDTLRQKTENDRIEYLYGLTKKYGFNITKQQFTAMYSVAMANSNAGRIYKPTKLTKNINVALIQATGAFKDKPGDYGWNKWLQNQIKIYDIEADHFSILDSGPVQEVAKSIKEMLK